MLVLLRKNCIFSKKKYPVFLWSRGEQHRELGTYKARFSFSTTHQPSCIPILRIFQRKVDFAIQRQNGFKFFLKRCAYIFEQILDNNFARFFRKFELKVYKMDFEYFLALYQLLAFKPKGLEFEMSVHRICEFDPFWTIFFFLQKDTHSDRRTDSNAKIVQTDLK